MALRASYLRRFPLPLPASCRGNGKRKWQPNRIHGTPLLRQGSRSSALKDATRRLRGWPTAMNRHNRHSITASAVISSAVD
jgi:hypothetical protein